MSCRHRFAGTDRDTSVEAMAATESTMTIKPTGMYGTNSTQYMVLLGSKVPFTFAQLSVQLPQHAMCRAHAMIFKLEPPGRDLARLISTALPIHRHMKTHSHATARGCVARRRSTLCGAGDKSPSCKAASAKSSVPHRMVFV